MVQIKKGIKLKFVKFSLFFCCCSIKLIIIIIIINRELIKPVLDNHEVDLNAYTMYREDNNKCVSLNDMEKNCEIFSGLRLFLKRKYFLFLKKYSITIN